MDKATRDRVAGSSLKRRVGKHRAPARFSLRAIVTALVPSRSPNGCRRGYHHYDGAQPIGGGIIRHVCVSCGTVALDLREAAAPVQTIPRLDRKRYVGLPADERSWGARA